MLVYANHFTLHGRDADEAVFKAVGGWLKEQLGFGLHPDQMKQNGEFNGYRRDTPSWLKVYATSDDVLTLYAWVLKSRDDQIPGRQWIVELGFKRAESGISISCVVKADESSTLAAARSPVMASCPRVITYLVRNVEQAEQACFTANIGALRVKSVGEDRDSYAALSAEIERHDRTFALLVVSPTKDGTYLVNVHDLQQKLLGIAQVVQVSSRFNSYEMAEDVGQQFSAWQGAINLIYAPGRNGAIRNRLFLSEEIQRWGHPQEQASHLLAWVTNNTNISRLRHHIRPEGVMQLALRRRMQAALANRETMDAAQLRNELGEAEKQIAEHEKYFDGLVEENAKHAAEASALRERLGELDGELGKKEYQIEALKDRLSRAGEDEAKSAHTISLIDAKIEQEPPLPLECLDLIERAYGEWCVILQTARSSAREMDRFSQGRELLGLLKKLVTDYRAGLLDGGDNIARNVFGKNEYAAKESETVMKSKTMCRQRTFTYEGKDTQMFRHLKIGVNDDVARTIRVHFHWDSEKSKIVIGYCGKHLPVSGY
jgi:hypothetical protein